MKMETLVEEETGVAIDEPKYDKNNNIISYKFLNAKKEPVVGTFVGAAGGIIKYDDKRECIRIYNNWFRW